MNTAILVILISWGGYQATEYQYEHPSMESCLEVLEKTIINIPQGAADNEWVAIATCRYRAVLGTAKI